MSDIIIPIRAEDCAFLYLTLKKKWYDMIASGGKRQEYRDYKQYWKVRIDNWCAKDAILVVAFSCGRRKADMFFTVDRENPVIVSKRAAFRNWGEPDKPHFAIYLDKRVQPMRGGAL